MLSRRTSDEGVVYYVSPLLERIGVPHAFSTRLGGISAKPFDSLNLGNPSDNTRHDDPDRIAENYARLRRAMACQDRTWCFVRQVHGGECLRAVAGEVFENGRCADAMICDDAAKLLSIRVADCVPILIASRDGQTVAAIHAGWRGIVAQVIGRTVEHLRGRALVAAIGPCIGFDNFEVGTEVLEAFARLFSDDPPLRRASNGKGQVDLREAAARQLIASGISRQAIDSTDRCTFRHAEEFFSHRRDHGVTGRMAAVIAARTS